MVDRLPSIPDQPLLDSAIQTRAGTQLRKQQWLDIMDRRDELPALPCHTGIVWEMQYIVWADQQRCDLLPDAATEQRKANDPKLHVRTRSKRMFRARKQHLVLICMIDTP